MTHTSSENIRDDIYRVTHHITDPAERAAYTFHKMGEEGHRVVADAWQCNCQSYRYSLMRNPSGECKHTRKARELDRQRRSAVLDEMIEEYTGG